METVLKEGRLSEPLQELSPHHHYFRGRGDDKHDVEDSVEGKQQAAPELEQVQEQGLELDEEADLNVEAAEEQGQDRGPV